MADLLDGILQRHNVSPIDRPEEEDGLAPLNPRPELTSPRRPTYSFSGPQSVLDRHQGATLDPLAASLIKDEDPDQYARDLDIAARTGMPLSLVRNNPDLDRSLSINQMREQLRNDNLLRGWMQQGNNGYVSHDVIEDLRRQGEIAQRLLDRPVVQGTFERISRAIGERGFDLTLLLQEFAAIGLEQPTGPIAEFLEEMMPLGGVVIGEGPDSKPTDIPLFTIGGVTIYHQAWDSEEAEAYFNRVEAGEQPLQQALRQLRDIDAFGADVDSRSLEQVYDAGALELLSWGLEQGIISTPDMLAAVFATPAYVAARTTEIGTERAENQGRDLANATDLLQALPAAAASALLERFAGRNLLGLGDAVVTRSIGGILSATGRGALIEASTEAIQESLEYLGATVGTDVDVDLSEMGMRALQGAVVGGIFGGTVRAGTASIETALDTRRASQREQAVRDLNNGNQTLRDRAPEVWASHTSMVMREGGVDNVRVDEEGSNILNQLVDEDTKASLDIAATEETQAGSGIQLSLDQFWNLSQDIIDQIAPNVSFHSNELTTNEVNRVKEITDQQDGSVEEQAAAAIEAGKQQEAVYENVLAQLQQSSGPLSQSPSAARAAAQQLSAAFASLAERSGLSIQEVSDRFLPRIVAADRPVTGEGVFEQTIDEAFERQESGELIYTEGEATGSLNIDEQENNIHVNRVRAQTEGGGRAALQQLIRVADSQGKTISLYAEPLDGRSVDDLIEMYEGMGFQFDGEYGVRQPFQRQFNQSESYLDDTIEIDGIERSAVNNEGRRIAYTRQGLENFWRWFGDSKVVDDQGRPLVVYHGDSGDSGFQEFDTSLGNLASGSFFSNVREVAESYIDPEDGGAIYPVYLSFQGDVAEINWEGNVYDTALTGEEFFIVDPDGDIIDGFETREIAQMQLDDWVSQEDIESDEGYSINSRKGRPIYKTTDHFVADSRADGKTSAIVRNVIDLGGNQDLEDVITSDVFVAFEPTQIKSVDNNTFDPQDPNIYLQEARGSIDFSNMEDIIIRLYKAENLSTFLHESGHLYLEMLGELSQVETASPQMKQDYQTVLDWLGVKDRSEITAEHHEKWAETYETYLKEGKAPSNALREAFNKFTAWLGWIYRTVAVGGGRADLTPEISEVMDRILATDVQIQYAQNHARMSPLFTEASQGSFTQEEFQAYQEAYQGARDSAHAELVQEVYAEERREKTKWWKEELAREEQIVLDRLGDDPAWRTRSAIQTGKLPNGSDLPGGMPSQIKLDRDQANDYGYDLPGGNQLVKKGGMNIEQAAQMYGFASGDMMLEALSNLPRTEDGKFHTAQSFAAAQAKAAMLEAHGDMLNDGSIADAAMEQIHGMRQADVVALELKALNKMANRTSAPSHRVLKAAAQRIIGGKKIGEIEGEGKFLQAERMYATRAQDAMARGDVAKAADYKQKQLLNMHLYRVARDARRESDTMINRLRGYQKRKFNPRKTHPDFVKQLKNLLAGISFVGRMTDAKMERLQGETFRKWTEEAQKEFGAQFHISGELDKALTRENAQSMTLNELRGLHDTARGLVKQGQKFSEEAEAEYKALRDSVEESIFDNATQLKARTRDRQFFDGVKGKFKQFMANHRTMSSVAVAMDGEQRGRVWEVLYQRIKQADDRYNDRSMKAGDDINNIFKKNYGFKDRMNFNRKVKIPGIQEPLSLNARLSIALNMGNKGNVDALLNTYTEEQLRLIGKSLSDKDWQVVQDVWAYIDSYWEDLAKLEERTTGVRPAKVEPTPFEITTSNGTKLQIDGGYYPLVADPEGSPLAQKDFEQRNSLDGFLAGGHSKSTTKHGSTIERVGFGKQREVWTSLTVLFNHMDGVIKDIEMREAVLEVNRIIEDPKIKNAVTEAAGIEYHTMMREWLKNTLGGPPIPTDPMESFVNYLRTGVSIAEMGLSVRTILQQPLGYLSSVGLLGEKYTAIGLGKFMMDRGEAVRMVMENSAFMRNRSATFNRDVRDAQRLVGVSGLKEPVVQAAFWGIQKFDLAVSVPTWLGAYQQAVDNGKSPVDAVDIADDIVSRTQGTGLARDLSPVMAGGVWKRLFTMFYSYFSAYHNIQSNLWGQARRANTPAGWLKYARMQMWVTVLPAIITAHFFGPGAEEDDWEEVAKYYGGATMAHAFSGVVGLRDIANAVATGFDYQLSPAQNPISSISNLGVQIAQGENDAALWKALVMATGYTLHIPGARAVNRGIDYFWEEGFDELDTFEGWWRLTVTGPEK